MGHWFLLDPTRGFQTGCIILDTRRSKNALLSFSLAVMLNCFLRILLKDPMA